MALIASKSDAFIDLNSRFQLKTCVEYLWIPVFIIWFLNLIFLLLHYYLNKRKSNQTSSENVSSDIVTAEQSQEQEQPPEQEQPQEQEQPPIFVTFNTAKLPRFTERFQLRQLQKAGEQVPSMSLRTSPITIDRSVSVASSSNLDPIIDENEDAFEPSKSRLFKVTLFILLITVIALLFASNNKVYFDIGM